MKATRLKGGWRLNLSDSEMSVLRAAVSEWQAGIDGDAEIAHFSGAEKAAIRRSFSAINWPAEVDDRRNV